jgi:hypothetical protein
VIISMGRSSRVPVGTCANTVVIDMRRKKRYQLQIALKIEGVILIDKCWVEDETICYHALCQTSAKA